MKNQRIFVISLILLIFVVVFTACVQALPEEPIDTGAQPVESAAEISEEEVLSASEYFASNPELKVVDRYANLADEVGTGSAFYAANPELLAANRYVAPVIAHKMPSGSSFFASNPELMVAHRYAAAATLK